MGSEATTIRRALQPVGQAKSSQAEQDEQELSEAAATICAKVMAQHSAPLTLLVKRLETICGHDIDAAANPLGPQSLIEMFTLALGPLDVSTRVHLKLLELFDRYVAQELEDVYEQANRVLIDAGVAPELGSDTDQARIQERTRPAPKPAAEPIERDFSQLLGLLNQARENGLPGVTRNLAANSPVSYTHLTLPTKRIV